MLQNTIEIIDRFVKQNIDDVNKSMKITKFISLLKKGIFFR